jgi:DNA-binding response OmpR family regulator
MSTVADALIVLVEDDKEIQRLVRDLLVREGFSVEVAETGGALDQVLAAQRPDLVILDLMLPGEDGLSLCRRLRARGSVPILMLTAKADPIDRVVGLEMGADDYLTKPFNPRELVARVKSVLRRATSDRRIDEGEELKHGDLVINAGRREVLVGDDEIQLAPKEFDLLWELLDHRGIVLTRDQLLERVWGYTFAGDTRTVDVHVRQIRRKLGEASPIVTVWGVGYKVATERASTPVT